jgi:hypothetical protein
MKITILLILIITLSDTADAQEAKIVDQLVTGTCGAFSSQLASRAEIGELIAGRPISSSVVCSCASERTKHDVRLAGLVAMDNQQFVRAVKNEGVKAYVVGRVLHAVLECFNKELDSSLAASRALQ